MSLMDKKKSKVDRHKHKPMVLRLPPVYRKQMAELAQKTRRTITEEAKIAFEAHLGQNGLWPPAPQE